MNGYFFFLLFSERLNMSAKIEKKTENVNISELES